MNNHRLIKRPYFRMYTQINIRKNTIMASFSSVLTDRPRPTAKVTEILTDTGGNEDIHQCCSQNHKNISKCKNIAIWSKINENLITKTTCSELVPLPFASLKATLYFFFIKHAFYPLNYLLLSHSTSFWHLIPILMCPR